MGLRAMSTSLKRGKGAMLPRIKGVHRVRKARADGAARVYHYVWRGGPRFWIEPDDGADGSAYEAAHSSKVAEERKPPP